MRKESIQQRRKVHRERIEEKFCLREERFSGWIGAVEEEHWEVKQSLLRRSSQVSSWCISYFIFTFTVLHLLLLLFGALFACLVVDDRGHMSFADFWFVHVLIVIVSITVLFSITWTQWNSVSFCLIWRYWLSFFLFESVSTFLTSPSPLKEHEMWLFLVLVLFICFLLFSLVLLCSSLCYFSLVFLIHLIWESGLMDLSVRIRYRACYWGMH